MVNIQNYGFALVREVKLDEISAVLYELEHTKTGARLVYLDREDENKTFSIGFPTPPNDDTGVFHIIEHSVLCGSKKYPLNDPFAELLKGSLNTFLNAMTYEDRTVYPVSSRCEKDFLNLVDVYLDAVLAPNMLDNPAIFMQEGWHYEYNQEEGSLSYNGVVFNEMKGAYSSADELGMMALNSALYSGTPYCRDSGGNPLYIPTLTYESFKKTHKKYYHPSAAKIVLDGRMDLEKLLPLIASHLDKYERKKIDYLDYGHPTETVKLSEISYEISENEDEHGKTRLMYGYVCSDYNNSEEHLALSVLCDVLCGSNAAPLKKALLDDGLAKDVTMYAARSRETTLVIEIRDADENRLDEIDSRVREVVSSLVDQGIDKNKITSTLNSIEFRLRERDFGTLPTGIAFAMSMYGVWMYGKNPEDALLLNGVLESVRAKIDSDYFESTLASAILENTRYAKVIMHPDKTLGEKNAAAERAALDNALKAMSADEINRIILDEQTLHEWQQAEPTEEALLSLPTLSLSDLPEKISRPTASVREINGVKTLFCPVKADGIVYVSMLLDASDLCKEQLTDLGMLSSALLNFPTENHDPLSLQNDAKANLGSLFASFTAGSKDGKVTPYLKIAASSLISKTDDLIRLVKELLSSKINSTDEVARLVSQAKSHVEDAIISSGESVALSRVEASMSEAGAVMEYLSGYEAYRTLAKINGDDEAINNLTERLADLLLALTDRRRLTLSIAGDVDDAFIYQITELFPVGKEEIVSATTPICAAKNEFVLTPSKVAYAVIGGKSDEIKNNLGLMRVTRSILSYEYLWNRVRVQGGAYGTGFVPRKDGSISFYSYRDPSPGNSLVAYRESVKYLNELAASNMDITKFIIGAVGEYDSIITPRTAALICTTDYLSGWSGEEEARVRKQLLSVKCADLARAANIIEGAIQDERIAIVGGSEQLESLNYTPERIIKI